MIVKVKHFTTDKVLSVDVELSTNTRELKETVEEVLAVRDTGVLVLGEKLLNGEEAMKDLGLKKSSEFALLPNPLGG